MPGMVSTVPAVLDALVQRFTLAIPDVQVSDGPPINEANDLVMVGFSGVPGEASVETTRTHEDMAAEPDREQYEIKNLVSAWKGIEDDATAVKATRDRAYELVNAMAAEIARDHTLSGLVMSTRLSTATLAQYYTEDGVSADVQVVISVDAFTRRA